MLPFRNSALQRSWLTHHLTAPLLCPQFRAWAPGLTVTHLPVLAPGVLHLATSWGCPDIPSCMATCRIQSVPPTGIKLSLTPYSSRCEEAGGADVSPSQIRVDLQHCKLALPLGGSLCEQLAGCWAVCLSSWAVPLSTGQDPARCIEDQTTDKNSAQCFDKQQASFSDPACLLVQMG